VVLRVRPDSGETGNPQTEVLREDESTSAALYRSQFARFNRLIDCSTPSARCRARFGYSVGQWYNHVVFIPRTGRECLDDHANVRLRWRIPTPKSHGAYLVVRARIFPMLDGVARYWRSALTPRFYSAPNSSSRTMNHHRHFQTPPPYSRNKMPKWSSLFAVYPIN